MVVEAVSLLVCGVVVGLIVGIALAARQAMDAQLRAAGLSRESAQLYGRAVRIFRRLAGLMLVDGSLSGDILSDDSRSLILAWLKDYRALTVKGDRGTVTGD